MIKVTRADNLVAEASKLEADAQILRKNGYETEASSVEKSAADMRARAQQMGRGRAAGVRFA